MDTRVENGEHERSVIKPGLRMINNDPYIRHKEIDNHMEHKRRSKAIDSDRNISHNARNM